MRELIALHEKMLARSGKYRGHYGFGWGGDSSTWWEAGDEKQDFVGWPEDLQADFHTLNNAIIAAMAEGFFFEASAGYDDEGLRHPRFRLFHDQEWGKSSDSLKGDFVRDRSLIEQLRELSWEEQRSKAAEHRRNLEAVIDVLEQLSKPTPTVWVPHEFPHEDPKNFLENALNDVSRIHAWYRERGHGNAQVSFDTVDELREKLPRMVTGSEEILSVVAWGKVFSSYDLDKMRRYGRKFATLNMGLE